MRSPRPHPPPWFYAASLVALAALGFVLERMGGPSWVDESEDMDVAVHAWVVKHRPGWPWLTGLFHLATRFANPNEATLATALVTFGLYVTAKRGKAGARKSEAVVWLAAILGGRLLSIGLKWVFRRDRPPLAGRLVAETTYSFPSGHSVFAAVFFTMLAVEVARLIPPRRVGLRAAAVAACLAMAVLVAASRVWLGVHYVTDVVAGLLLGFGWVFAVALARRAWAHWRGEPAPGA